MHFHVKTGHQGRSWTISSMRNSGFWILGSNANVNSVIFNCFHCKRNHRKLQQQVMADLPEVRVNPSPPFSYVGVDCFGPFGVREGRKTVKRYGILYVCMSSRAVHIEISTSLSTDAFINSLRRVIAIRGPIRTLYCDKGTNF